MYVEINNMDSNDISSPQQTSNEFPSLAGWRASSQRNPVVLDREREELLKTWQIKLKDPLDVGEKVCYCGMYMISYDLICKN